MAERLGGHRFSQAVDPCRMDLVAVGEALGWRAVAVGSTPELTAALASAAELIVAHVPRP